MSRKELLPLLGKKIQWLRKQNGFSIEGLAKATDSSKSYIWELENRDGVKPSAEKITKLANALNVTADFLLYDQNLEPDELVVDLAFFRKYQKLDTKDKNRLRKILDILIQG